MPARHAARQRRAPARYQGDGTYVNVAAVLGPGHSSLSPLQVSSPTDQYHGEGDVNTSITEPQTENVELFHGSLSHDTNTSKNHFLPNTILPHTPIPRRPIPSSHLSSSTSLTTAPQPATSLEKMANIKMTGLANRSRNRRAQRKRQEARYVEVQDTDSDTSGSPSEQDKLPQPFPPKNHIQNTSIDTDLLGRLPAAFPTQDLKPPVSQEDPGYRGRWAVHEVMEDRYGKKATEATKTRSRKDIAMMWDCVRFPESLPAKERQWYMQLKGMMPPKQRETPVIHFAGLYWSMRDVIIANIRDQTAHLYIANTYLAVRKLLNINQRNLGKIILQNIEAFDDGIPEHLTELLTQARKVDPRATVDEETPTMAALDRAILYLRNNHLPATLLGKWMFYTALGVSRVAASQADVVETTAQNGIRPAHLSLQGSATTKSAEDRASGIRWTSTPKDNVQNSPGVQNTRAIAETMRWLREPENRPPPSTIALPTHPSRSTIALANCPVSRNLSSIHGIRTPVSATHMPPQPHFPFKPSTPLPPAYQARLPNPRTVRQVQGRLDLSDLPFGPNVEVIPFHRSPRPPPGAPTQLSAEQQLTQVDMTKVLPPFPPWSNGQGGGEKK